MTNINKVFHISHTDFRAPELSFGNKVRKLQSKRGGTAVIKDELGIWLNFTEAKQ